MAQPWGVSAMEETTETHKGHGSILYRIGESLKNSVTPESSAATRQRDQHLEQEHSVPQSQRNAAFAPDHHVGGTNLTVEQGTHRRSHHDEAAEKR
ncbi:hypothetical protein B5807_00258 [Epicoccum nigrum]|uniref:Uncharacterized protein n=1 Tax=Epicoccum nigrum TaxID=105696 RepID=A0A1Y2MF11_EPING|nr:hypothetical protein B5807_00258 [Epicoccum nigrum]